MLLLLGAPIIINIKNYSIISPYLKRTLRGIYIDLSIKSAENLKHSAPSYSHRTMSNIAKPCVYTFQAE